MHTSCQERRPLPADNPGGKGSRRPPCDWSKFVLPFPGLDESVSKRRPGFRETTQINHCRSSPISSCSRNMVHSWKVSLCLITSSALWVYHSPSPRKHSVASSALRPGWALLSVHGMQALLARTPQWQGASVPRSTTRPPSWTLGVG